MGDIGRTVTIDANEQRIYDMTPPKADTRFFVDATRGIHQHNPLNTLFFSAENIEALQQGLRYLVYKHSCQKYVIDRQSDDDLKIVMRSIYLEHAQHQPFAITEQVRNLNAKVLDYCLPRVLNEIDAYMKFRQEISQLPTPMERSANVNSKGTKVLEFKTF